MEQRLVAGATDETTVLRKDVLEKQGKKKSITTVLVRVKL